METCEADELRALFDRHRAVHVRDACEVPDRRGARWLDSMRRLRDSEKLCIEAAENGASSVTKLPPTAGLRRWYASFIVRELRTLDRLAPSVVVPPGVRGSVLM